jgi:hypothetical protein
MRRLHIQLIVGLDRDKAHRRSADGFGNRLGIDTSTTAPIATGRNEPVPGWELHPLWTERLSRRTRTIPLVKWREARAFISCENHVVEIRPKLFKVG